LILVQSGKYYDHSNHNTNQLIDEECSVISIAVEEHVSDWQKAIHETINGWMNSKS